MTAISEQSIRAEAERIFEAKGRPIWSHPLDYWTEATSRLAADKARPSKRPARRTIVHGLGTGTTRVRVPLDRDAGPA